MEQYNEIENWYKKEDPWGYKTNPNDLARKSEIIHSLLSLNIKFNRALDIGCGEGWITKDLPAKEIDGIEISNNATNIDRFPNNVNRIFSPQEIFLNDNLTFDGVYQNVWNNRQLLIGKEIICFIMGNYVGDNNSFDTDMPLEKYCTWEQLNDLHNIGCKLGWHTWSHKDLTKLSKEEIIKEITPPWSMDELSYPYGKFNDLVIECAKKVGFKRAYSVTEGDNSDYQLKREYLCLQ